MRTKTIECEPSLKEIENIFNQGNIIIYEGYDEKRKTYIYRDHEHTRKKEISSIYKVIECPFCKERKKAHNKLKKQLDGNESLAEWELNKTHYIKQLKECPECKSILSSSIADFDGKTHRHSCENCGLHFPENGFVYEGDYVDDELKYNRNI